MKKTRDISFTLSLEQTNIVRYIIFIIFFSKPEVQDLLLSFKMFFESTDIT